ncbi:hypothetical protein [Yersinia frederiksenii]|uniref:hypothetical protein n=1 Tax=Yersinia frederiksenii TaxID=29484 RepID=UPI0028F3E6DC|nr:hypothetical protein [Yersinia frederiksenii]
MAKAEAVTANAAKEVWKSSIDQSRVNLKNGDGSTGSGLDYAWKKHGGDWDLINHTLLLPKTN